MARDTKNTDFHAGAIRTTDVPMAVLLGQPPYEHSAAGDAVEVGEGDTLGGHPSPPSWLHMELFEQDCLQRLAQWKARDTAEGAHTSCPVFWDQVLCWPSSPAGALAVVPCFEEFNGVYYDTSQNATRWCFANGSWAPHSDYSQCRELPSPVAPAAPATELALFYAGFEVSLLALAAALWIFLQFKDLKCLRNTIHINLMTTYIFYDATWILSACVQDYASDVISCYILVILIHYFYLTNFFWMFVEGLYLYFLVVATFTGEKMKLSYYVIIGWGLPCVIVVMWAFAKHFGHIVPLETTDDLRGEMLLMSHCPWMASDDFDWIHEAPVITLLAVNLAFLVSILWVLIIKMKSANTPETQQYRKTTKALLVLFPLLGITYILMMQGPMEGVAGAVFRNMQALLVSLQGFTVALFYCFLNTEVQNTLRHRVERWREARAVGGGRSKDWSPRWPTESIRLGDMPFACRPMALPGGGLHERESTVSEATTSSLLGPPSGGRLSNGSHTFVFLSPHGEEIAP